MKFIKNNKSFDPTKLSDIWEFHFNFQVNDANSSAMTIYYV
jgi:hypothetical protein